MEWDGPMTHRQFMAWRTWLADQWNVPDRRDHYLMQVAAEIRLHRGKSVKKLSELKIPFKTAAKRGDDDPVNVDAMKEMAVKLVGGKAVRKTRTREEAEALGWKPNSNE